MLVADISADADGGPWIGAPSAPGRRRVRGDAGDADRQRRRPRRSSTRRSTSRRGSPPVADVHAARRRRRVRRRDPAAQQGRAARRRRLHRRGRDVPPALREAAVARNAALVDDLAHVEAGSEGVWGARRLTSEPRPRRRLGVCDAARVCLGAQHVRVLLLRVGEKAARRRPHDYKADTRAVHEVGRAGRRRAGETTNVVDAAAEERWRGEWDAPAWRWARPPAPRRGRDARPARSRRRPPV